MPSLRRTDWLTAGVFSLHAQLETLPGTLCARKFQSLFLVVCVTGQSWLLTTWTSPDSGLFFFVMLFFESENASSSGSKFSGREKAATGKCCWAPVWRFSRLRPSSPVGREGAASQPGGLPVTHCEGTAAVLPHADGASVCLVCWLTSSTLPGANSGCDSGGWHSLWRECQSNAAFLLR